MRFPRKLKKKLMQIPSTGFCYGSALGDKGKMVNGRKKYKHHICPFHSKSGSHCSLLNNKQFKDIEDADYRTYAIKDQTAICEFESPIVKMFYKKLR
jgi:hypothetical protein